MTIDTRLISVKDGGRFAMSWIAGTNPKALRLNFHRAHIYTIDVPEVCEHMMETIKSKKDNLSFRILFKLCFGTIHIFAEQVRHLYNVTINFVAFNTFVLKQYSRKRTGNTTDNGTCKRRRLASSESLDITSLLLESELFNNYSEEKFKFPDEMCVGSGKKQNTSTCIQIKQITIRQISWDNPQPGEEEAFGEATQEERMMLLSELSGADDADDEISAQICTNRKRKSSGETFGHIPSKRSNGVLNESIDDIRCEPSTHNYTLSGFNLDTRSQHSIEMETNNSNHIANVSIQDQLISIQKDFSSEYQAFEEQSSLCRNPVDESNRIPTTKVLPVSPLTEKSQTELNNPAKFVPQKTFSRKRKRPGPHLIIDKVIKLPKSETETGKENILQNCFDYKKKEHIAQIEKYREQEVFNVKMASHRFQSALLLHCFKSNLKARSKQDDNRNRQLIIVEILGDDYDTHKSEFRLKSKERSKTVTREPLDPVQTTKEIYMPPVCSDNISFKSDVNNNCYQSDGYFESYELKKDTLSLKCSLEEIDPYAISFNFPIEAGKQRSEWGKEGILMKLLWAWISKDANINMRTIIVGANRINAALTFHTLLDLAGLQYIEIVKDKTNSIESINMGQEMIRKINESYVKTLSS